MTRNWLLGVATSAALHGGAAAVLLTTSPPPQGMETLEIQPQAIAIELVDVNRAASGEAQRAEPTADMAATTYASRNEAAAFAAETTAAGATQAASGAEASLAAAAPDPGAMSDYYRRVESHLARFHTYPATLEDARPTGVVRVGLIVQRDGRVIDAWIETSSGVAPLDVAALQTLRRAEPLPGLPATLPGAIDLIVPLRYAAPTRAGEARAGA
ncbi:energy transducer TonB [Brevundimonas olei]|uniref:energy transducer TonB family protein n=1 Tax=Brevundimonas olei TaxID=657642 RepID=UPI0031DB88FB